MEKKDRTILSTNILQMKFMNRSTKAKELLEEGKKPHAISEEHWVMDSEFAEKECLYKYEPSMIRIQELQFGRVSFQGCNPEIEKVMRQRNEDQDLTLAGEREDELGVDDEEMAQRQMEFIGRKRRASSSDDDSSDNEVATKKQRSFMNQGNSNDGKRHASSDDSEEAPTKKQRAFRKPVD